MSIWYIIGIIGAISLGYCGVPQVVKTYRTRKCDDISFAFLVMWFIGEIFTFTYILEDNLSTQAFQLPLIFNYTLNTLITTYLLYMKLFHTRNKNA